MSSLKCFGVLIFKLWKISVYEKVIKQTENLKKHQSWRLGEEENVYIDNLQQTHFSPSYLDWFDQPFTTLLYIMPFKAFAEHMVLWCVPSLLFQTYFKFTLDFFGQKIFQNRAQDILNSLKLTYTNLKHFVSLVLSIIEILWWTF